MKSSITRNISYAYDYYIGTVFCDLLLGKRKGEKEFIASFQQ